MPGCKRERKLSGALPLAFLSMPMGGALTVVMSALTATSLRVSPGAMTPRMLLRSRHLCDHGPEEDCGYRVGNRVALRLQRAQAEMRRGAQDSVVMQV